MLGSCLRLEGHRLSTTKCKNDPFCQLWHCWWDFSLSPFESWPITSTDENLLFCSSREMQASASFRELCGNLQKKAMVKFPICSVWESTLVLNIYILSGNYVVGTTINCERDTASLLEYNKLACGELLESLVKGNMKSFEEGSYTVLEKSLRNLYCSWSSMTRGKRGCWYKFSPRWAAQGWPSQ